MTVFVTPRLRLRKARPDDLAAMHAVLSNVEAMRYWSTPPHASDAVTEARLTAMIATKPEEGNDYVIELAGEVIGKAGLYRFPEIGILIHPLAWGRGYATESLRAIIDHAFHQHCLPAIDADSIRGTPHRWRCCGG